EEWAKTDLFDAAAAMPGVEVHIDDGGKEARRFGSATSGMALLYDASGRLVFNGGITSARGHAGDNAGSAAIIAALQGDAAVRNQAMVFGCQLSELGAP